MMELLNFIISMKGRLNANIYYRTGTFQPN